jgi:HEPN domain-containing protein
MLDAHADLVRSWLTKAQHDLGTARKLAADPDPYLDTAIYHCQQSAEKAVKGFLVFHSVRFSKTHDIEVLSGSAASIEPRFAAWLDIGERLTRYATRFRYPSAVMEPSREEFDRALSEAESFCAFVLSLLPAQVHPRGSP